MKTYLKNYQAGFTLLEFIVALVVAAIMASMIYTYFGNALTQSSVPIFRLQKASNLHQVMENIVTDYNRLNQINLRYKWRSGHPYQLGDIVLPSDLGSDNINSKIANNGRYYICTTAGISGSYSGTGQPGWTVSTPPGTEIIDGTGTLRWKEWGYVWKDNTVYPASSIVVPAINNGHFYRGGGTSGTDDPDSGTDDWTTTAGGTENDGGITWTEVGTILESTAVENLSTLLPNVGIVNNTATRYGTKYTVYGLDFIGLDESTHQETTTYTEKNLLKVTIKNNDSAETLTQVFTIR